jgi:ATP-dependent Lon protease
MSSKPKKPSDPGQGSDPSHGYSLFESSDSSERESGVRLLIPDALRAALQAEELQRLEQEQAAHDERIARAVALRAADQKTHEGKSGQTDTSSSFEQRKEDEAATKDRDKTFAQQLLWGNHAAAPLRSGQSQRYPVFQTSEAMGLYRRLGRYAKEDRERYQLVYDQLSASGQLRVIAKPAAAALRQLAASQPHMAPVVEFVQDQIELARRARKPLRIPPMLLAGEAGIGKTHFAQGLAAAMNAPLSIQRLDSELTGALMLGSDRKWGNTQHGLLFELLALGLAANPVVVLDEIDKMNRVHHRVQSSLYSLLEPVSAGRLRDISLEFEFDASLVTWIATANDTTLLDQPLRSRFKEFHIQLPTDEQCLVLACEVMLATIRSVAVPGFRVETNRLERDLAHLPARQIQQITREAMARALKAGRKHLERQDLPPDVLDDDTDGRSSGYLH